MTNFGSITRPGLDFLPSVAAIVPAFNEANSITFVLEALAGVSALSEIIVVDDGSLDGTQIKAAEVASSDTRIKVIQHQNNYGKGLAIYTGWKATPSPYLLTLDADLVGLSPCHIESLIQPVLERRADMTLGLFRHGGFWTDLSHRVTPWLTGQRCFRSGLLNFAPMKALEGYGLETALTLAARTMSWRVQPVFLQGVTHPPSEFHRGPWVGVTTRLRMYAQIIRAYMIMRRTRSWKEIVARIKNFSTQS
jgi:glycosyltransferase involved in cell wall biosynthesis